jgi:ATP-dependent Clp protease adaptor protein ClpS
MSSKDSNISSNNTGTIIEEKIEIKKPSFYQVLIMNDDYTPMEFVILVLEKFFKKSRAEATQIMLHVHQKGMGVCGLYPYEIAETKIVQVMDFAKKNQHPLQCTMEKE